MTTMIRPFTIVGLGEALYDLYPRTQQLGGAALNVAVHAHQLAHPVGGRGILVSRVGQDDPGRQLIAELHHRGLNTDMIQTDPDHETGTVLVHPNHSGEVEYQIAPDAAWDWLQFDPDVEALAQKCDAVCFGSLAQRCGQSRSAIQRFLSAARRAVKVFDLNLRDNPDHAILQRSCEFATIVKGNIREISTLGDILGLNTSAAGGPQQVNELAAELLDRFELDAVAITQSALGILLFNKEGRHETPPVSFPPTPDADPVGAGDACSAALMVARVLRWPVDKTLNLANHVGAYVASQPGATPPLPQFILDLVHQ